jgi:hypothetical protein
LLPRGQASSSREPLLVLPIWMTQSRPLVYLRHGRLRRSGRY